MIKHLKDGTPIDVQNPKRGYGYASESFQRIGDEGRLVVFSDDFRVPPTEHHVILLAGQKRGERYLVETRVRK